MVSKQIDIHVENTAGNITGQLSVEKNTLILHTVKVQFATDAQAQACKDIKFDAEWISGNSFGDINSATYTFQNNNGILIPLNGFATTLYCPHIKMDMKKNMEESFPYKIYGQNLTGFQYLSLVFEITE